MDALVLPLICIACSACSASGSGSPDAKSAATASTPSSAATATGTTTADQTEKQEPPVSRREWRSRFFAWVDNVRVPATQVGLVASDARLRRQLRRSSVERESFTTSVGALRGCERWVAELSPPPPSFRRPTRLAERACAHYAEAAALLEGEKPPPDAFRAVARRLTAAARLLHRANGALRKPRFDALPLRVRGGRVGVSRVEPLLTRVARAIRPMGERVPLVVRCWSQSDWPRLRREFKAEPTVAGFVVRYSQTVNLAPTICDALGRLAYSKETGAGEEELDGAFAVGALMHEAAHVYYEVPKKFAGPEAVATCWGMQHVRPAARMLGLDAATAARLADLYWNEIYPYEDPRYRSDDCRNGGFLDHRPTTDVWP